MLYDVEITRDTHEMINVEVEAESEDAAESLARSRNMDGEYDQEWNAGYPDVRESYCATSEDELTA